MVIQSDFEWDDRKSEHNLQDRGFDFETAKRIFDGEVLEEIDDRRDYGETRIAATGQINGRGLHLARKSEADYFGATRKTERKK